MTKKAFCLFAAVFLLCLFFNAPFLSALSGGHRGAVTALFHDGEGNIFSAGEDGFLVRWDGDAARQRYQISRYALQGVVVRPGAPHIAVVERGGFDRYRVSVWDYRTKENLFTLRFPEAISYITYSAAGSFLIIAPGGAHEGLLFIHPETGALLESPAELSGTVAFAATSAAERVMLNYLPSGSLFYWDIETGEVLYYFEVPPHIRSLALFGGSRFLGGFDAQGLLVLDAATGAALARNASIQQGSIFAGAETAAAGFVRFYVLSFDVVYRMEINLAGNLNILSRMVVPAAAGRASSVIAGAEGSVVVGTDSGLLWRLSETGALAMQAETSRQIIHAAVSAQAIAFMCEDGGLGFIPLDFSLFENNAVLTLRDAGAYTHIAAYTAGDDAFLFWRPGLGAPPPMLKTLAGNPKDGETAVPVLLRLPVHFPLRAAGLSGGSLLFLNTTGALAILDRASGEVRFSHAVPAAMDAVLIDEDTLLFARSAAAGTTPFLMISISTGETVPLAYPAIVGTRVYRGASGAVYGVVVDPAHTGGVLQTAIIRLDTSAPWLSVRLAEYIGEDPYLSMAESGGNLAFALGNAAALVRGEAASGESVALARSRGLPAHIADGGRWFVVLDGDGGINWHDNQTGSLLAVFRLGLDSWVLERGGEVVGGGIVGW